MYQKFKDCLLKPSKIGKYVDEKISRTIIYFLLLLIIYTLPSFVSLISVDEMPNDYANMIVASFSNSNTINYRLENENNKMILKKTDSNATNQYVNIEYFAGMNINLLILFTEDEEASLDSYQFTDDLIGKNVVLITLAKEGFYLNFGTLKINSNHESNNVQELVTTSTSQFYRSYEDLGITSIDFSIATTNKTIFKKDLNDAYVAIYKKSLPIILAVGVPYILINGIISLLLEVLFLALLMKILYMKFNVKYGAICRIVILSYTPRVIFNLLSIFWSSLIMYFIGQILTIIYVTIGLRYYIMKNIGQNIVNFINRNKNNQGDNNNEL